MISKAIENAQKKVEAHNFDIRKHLIEYDDVMNKQREVIYTQRKEVLAGENIRGTIESILDETVQDMVATFCPEKTPPTEWNWEGLFIDFGGQFNFAAELPDGGRARGDPGDPRTSLCASRWPGSLRPVPRSSVRRSWST